MKLLFIENRYKTYFFDEIMNSFTETHDVHWVIQNSKFKPKVGKKHVIPFPDHTNYKPPETIKIDYNKIIESDRQQNFFGKKDRSYFYYYTSRINSILEEIKPDVVFGESTAFHELITIELCKNKNILYLHPTSCRYPSGRFSFYQYDSLLPYEGSKEKILEDNAKKIIHAIANRTAKPDYMKRVSISRSKKLKDKAKLIKSYYQGEKYNTPSPRNKFIKERQKKKLIEQWDSIGKDALDTTSLTVLYPLHMQPEANIDVWGRAHRDQLQTIKKIHSELGDNDILYVKPNPKSKYELSNDLLQFIKRTPNVEALKHSVSMTQVFNDIDIVITVTGTIAIECILSNKPVLTLVKTLHNKALNCIYAEDFKEIKKNLNLVKTNSFPKLEESQKIEFLNILNETSYKGIVSDPYTNKDSVSEANLKDMVLAFQHVLNQVNV